MQKDSRPVVIAVGLVCLTAFILRLAYAMHMGPADFWQRGYFYYEIAQNIAAGKGISWTTDGLTQWASRPPLYPLFLTPAPLFGGNYLLIVVPQALMGAVTVLIAFLIGRKLFGSRPGLLAAALTAIYPFYVVHDTAQQETVMQTFMAALSVYLLLLSRESHTNALLWLATGFTLGLCVLVRGTMLPFSLFALVWIAFLAEGPAPEKLQRCLSLFLAFALVVGVWLARNEAVLGRPILTSETGQLFWISHNAETFSRYPKDSMDLSWKRALLALNHADRTKLASLGELDRSAWYQQRGWDYVRHNPGQTAEEALRKVEAGFSWSFNPSPTPQKQMVYSLSYGPIALLGFAGMFIMRRGWREHSLIWLQFLAFILVTGIYFAHTNHRTYLDVYLIVFSAAVIDRVWTFVRKHWSDTMALSSISMS